MVFVLRAFTCFQKVEKVSKFDEARTPGDKAQAFAPPPAGDGFRVAPDQRAGLDVGQESAGAQLSCDTLGLEGRFN